MVSDVSGNIYVAGEFQGITDFDPGISTYTLNAPSAISNPFIMKLNSSGNFIWANAFSCNSNAIANSVALDASGAIYTGGYFNSTIDVDPSSVAQFNLNSSGAEDAFIQKMNQTPSGIKSYDQRFQSYIFPNPNNGIFYCKAQSVDKNYELKVYDLYGKLIHTEIINTEKIVMNAAEGIYFYKLYRDSELISSGKFLIE
jgi:hypothetical protein